MKFSETFLKIILHKQNIIPLGILRYVFKIHFHKIQKCAPQMGFNDKKSLVQVAKIKKFDNLNNMGIHWTSLKTGVQNNLQNWKILKIGQVMVKNRFFLCTNFIIILNLTQSNFYIFRFCRLIWIQKFKSVPMIPNRISISKFSFLYLWLFKY